MANFIPIGKPNSFHDSGAERILYHALKKLPDNYFVFYSVKWGQKGYSKKYRKGEADFLIFDPLRGFLVVEVKGGGIKCKNGAWSSIDRGGNEHSLKCSPLDQAWRSVNRFKDLLLESPSAATKEYRERLYPIVWFPNINRRDIKGSLPSDYLEYNTFTESDLDNPERAINNAFMGYGAQKIAEYIPDSTINEIIDTFSPSFRIIPSFSSELRERNFLFNELTYEQAALLDYLDEQQIAGIHGVSGTGKTMIALERARRLPKDSSVLFLCYNRLLLEFLIKTFSKTMPNVTFANLNRLYAKVGGEENVEAGVITDFLLDGFSDN